MNSATEILSFCAVIAFLVWSVVFARTVLNIFEELLQREYNRGWNDAWEESLKKFIRETASQTHTETIEEA